MILTLFAIAFTAAWLLLMARHYFGWRVLARGRSYLRQPPLLSAWRNDKTLRAPARLSRIEYISAHEKSPHAGSTPAALNSLCVKSKCPVVRPLSIERLGNKSDSRPGRISKRSKRTQYSLAAWLVAGGTLR